MNVCWCLDACAPKFVECRPTDLSEQKVLTPTPEQENIRGAVITVLGMGAFILTDAFSKYAVAELELPMLQVLSLRGLGMVIFLTLLNSPGSETWSLVTRRRDALLLLVRVLFEVLGSWFFNLGLVHLPMSLATAIVQVRPP